MLLHFEGHGNPMSKRKYRTRYLIQRRQERIRRLKIVAIALATILLISGGVYIVISHLVQGEIHLTKELKLGEDD